MAIGDTAMTMSVQFRVEELRLLMWGRDWGLVEEDTGSTTARSLLDDSDEEGGSESGAISTKKDPSLESLDNVDEELEIPGLRDLTLDVLGRIHKSLEEWKSVGSRYGVATARDEDSPGFSSHISQDLVSSISERQAKQAKEISSRTKITSKIRWAIKDKQELQELLTKLTHFNDSLEKLLPRRQRASLARGLAGEILNILENGTMTESRSEIDAQLNHLQSTDEVKGARIVLLKRQNQTERAEKPMNVTNDTETMDNKPTPFAKQSTWMESDSDSMEIPFDHFIKLVEPKLEQIEIQTNDDGWIRGKYVPLKRSLAVYAPTVILKTGQMGRDAQTTPVAESPARITLVEWRPAAHESIASELTEQDLKDRRDHIARLLHRTSITDVDFRVLDCFGYTKSHGHTSDGSTHDLVGYVYRYPDFASTKSLPVSLRDLLGEAYKSDNPRVPPLEVRFKLAKNLAIALYQLQCAGWVHRKVSSYNVIFFKNRNTEEVDLNQPFLVGWQYSRPDDQRRLFPSERSSEGIADLDMYVHRMRMVRGGDGRFPRFRKSFDIYSLGVILIEIAFWEPIMALANEEERALMEQREKPFETGYKAKGWWKAILRTAREELAAEMGVPYRDAVLFCLLGGEAASRVDTSRYFDRNETEEERREGYYVDNNFEEIGIEKEFYWKVLKPLESFRL